jgi:two-component system nitrogen regulation sensor histidine kinase GlnL
MNVTSASQNHRFQAFDWLATPIAVLESNGTVVFVNSELEDVMGQSRRSLEGESFLNFFSDPKPLLHALSGAKANEFAALRYDAELLRINPEESLPVHVIVAQSDQSDEVIIELLPIQQQTRQDREERLIDQAQANKELIRNLAHEIKNPLGGIRGAAQLLEMEMESKELTEYTQVIIREADRLQLLVDRLLAPHRRPHMVGDVNIHEVCERVRSLVVLIQAVLNIAHNAALALSDRVTEGDAQLTFKTRITRQVTFGKQRYRLALELHVIDNGPGVPDSIKDRIFFPLISGREGGSGLGLTLAQTFVQQHHGMIECESVPGRTDFKILIPLP